MDFNITRQQWIDRFMVRLSQLESSVSSLDHQVERATKLWQSSGQLDPAAVAESDFTARRLRASEPALSPFEATRAFGSRPNFEQTERIPVERSQTQGEYVRNTEEWIARCVAHVLKLDPMIRSDEAHRSVADLAELERWRVMGPEAAADQLYTPIKPRTE